VESNRKKKKRKEGVGGQGKRKKMAEFEIASLPVLGQKKFSYVECTS
jgi:hypothetical protein